MEVFEKTSHKPYDKHQYKLKFTNGKSVIFDNYEDVLGTWFQNYYHCEIIEVLDKKEKKSTQSKGFNKK